MSYNVKNYLQKYHKMKTIFHIDTFRGLLTKYENKEMSIGKLVEELNIVANKGRDQGEEGAEDKRILDEARLDGLIIGWFEKWCKESKRGGGVLIGTSIKELLKDFYKDCSHQSEEAEAVEFAEWRDNYIKLEKQRVQEMPYGEERKAEFIKTTGELLNTRLLYTIFKKHKQQ